MTVITDLNKAIAMGKRIYNNKLKIEKDEQGAVKYSDDEAIKSLCSKIFNEDGTISNFEDLRNFNKIIVEVANEEARPKFDQIIDMVAESKKVKRYDQMQYYEVPKRGKITMALSASSTGVDFTKIPSKKGKIPVLPKQFQFGAKYSISDMINDPVNAFRKAVDFVIEGKLEFIFKQIMTLSKNGATAGKIPNAQQLEAAGITLADFKKVESKLINVGGGKVRPVLIADRNFISPLADQQLTVSGTDELKTSLLRDLSIDIVSKTIAMTLDNPYVDDKNVKKVLDPTEAIMLAGGNGKPFRITEFGDLRTLEDMPSIENEEVLMKLDYIIDITLFAGNLMAYLHDTSVVS